MHKPVHHGHTTKHTSNSKHHAHAKHRPVHHRKVHHHVSVQHAAGKSPHKHKPRHLSYGINCSIEALADSAPFLVTDEDVMRLFSLTPHTDGVLIEDALIAAARYGLAGHYLSFREADYFRPGCITGMTLAEGTHAAFYGNDGVNMWGEMIMAEDLPLEEAWEIRWL